MEYRNLVDLHTHSDNSRDGEHSVTLMCEKAVARGIKVLAVTDHCTCQNYIENNHAVTCRQSAFEVRKARAIFNGQIELLSGVELASPLKNLDAVDDVLKNNFDLVLASVHRITGKKKSFANLDYNRETNKPEFLMPRYFNDIFETAKWGGFDALAHFTYPLRYFPGELLLDFDLMGCCGDVIREIFKLLITNGKALEINTAGGEYSIKNFTSDMHPSFELVKLFKEMGGEYITIGSDAHRAENIGSKISEAFDMAQSAGFKYVTVYKNRTPNPIVIE